MSEPEKLELDIDSAKEVALEEIEKNLFTDKEVENFLKILSILIEKDVIEIEAYEEADCEDGKLDIIETIAKKLSQLLEGNIDTLGLPSAIGKTLKTLKALVGLIKNAKNDEVGKRKKASKGSGGGVVGNK